MYKNDQLGNIVKIISGGTPSRRNSKYWNGNIPWVKISDMINGYIDKTEDQKQHFQIS